MSSKKDINKQEPQTEEVKEEKVEAAAEEIKDEAKAESKEDEKRLFLGENARKFYGFTDLPVLPYIKNMSE